MAEKSIGKWRILCKGDNVLGTFVSRSRELLNRFMATMPKIHNANTVLQYQYKGADRWINYDADGTIATTGKTIGKRMSGTTRGYTTTTGRKPATARRRTTSSSK